MKRALILIALTSTACTTVGPDYRAPGTSELGVPAVYGSAPQSGESAVDAEALASWWTQFDDPLLNEIVGRALGANQDLAIARSRLQQARETVVQARAGGLPNLTGSGSVGRTEDSVGNGSDSYSLGADASWEADLFGGTRRSIEAARADAAASQYDLAGTQVSLVGDVATNYVQLRLAQQRRDFAQESQAIANENLQIAEWRLQAGLVSSIDVEQARAELAQVAATIPSHEQSAANAMHRLGVLTGQAPAALNGRLAAVKPIPAPRSIMAVGIPADTLRQRPDVRSAERKLAAETARIGVSEAELYPQLRLTGSLGTTALTLGGLTELITGSLFATLSQTIFDGGAGRSRVRSQTAAAEGAFATYKQSVLSALEDVENALTALRVATQREAQFERAAEASRNQTILARSQYRAGLTSFQQLLEAERSLISANDNLFATRADRTLAVIQLYRALGGGWSSTTSATKDLSA